MSDNDPADFAKAEEIDFSAPVSDDFEALARDRVPIRTLIADDLDAIVHIDGQHTGRDRRAYYERKMVEALKETGVRVSLAALVDDHVVGFVMANVDYGEFGIAEPEAVIHAIAVDRDFAGHEIATALLSQLLTNLAALRVERVVTEVDWNSEAMTGLINFLKRRGFRPSARIPLVRRV